MTTTTKPNLLTRYGYMDTDSHAGSPENVAFMEHEISEIRTWTNSNGNPSYVFHFKPGTMFSYDGDKRREHRTLYCVDDYNGYPSGVPIKRVKRKKDMF